MEPLTKPPMHIRDVHTLSPFSPSSAVAFVEDDGDELADATGLLAVDVEAELELLPSLPP